MRVRPIPLILKNMAIPKFKHRSIIEDIMDPFHLQHTIDWLCSFFKRKPEKTHHDYVDELNAENRARARRLKRNSGSIDWNWIDRYLKDSSGYETINWQKPPIHPSCRTIINEK